MSWDLIKLYFAREPGFWKVVVFTILMLSMIFIANSSFASHNYCQEQSNIAFRMADARDNGIPMRAFLSRSESLSGEEQAEYLYLIKMVYGSPDALPERLGAIAYNLCVDHE